jgi:hypothetical protein
VDVAGVVALVVAVATNASFVVQMEYEASLPKIPVLARN